MFSHIRGFQQWIFVFISEETKEARLFLVQDRTRNTLLEIIRQNIIEGSLIQTDEWIGYYGLSAYGYSQEQINGLSNFYGSTNIEGLWG